MKVTKKYKDWEDTVHKAVLKVKNADELTASEFMQMCLDLYEKEGWFNDVSIVVHGMMGGDILLSVKPKKE